MTRVTEPRIDATAPLPIAALLRISPLGAVGALSAGILAGAFLGMAPIFGQRLALEEARIAQLMSAAILGGAFLQWPIGHLSDRIDRRTVLIATSVATATVASVSAFVVVEDLSGLVPAWCLPRSSVERPRGRPFARLPRVFSKLHRRLRSADAPRGHAPGYDPASDDHVRSHQGLGRALVWLLPYGHEPGTAGYRSGDRQTFSGAHHRLSHRSGATGHRRIMAPTHG